MGARRSLGVRVNEVRKRTERNKGEEKGHEGH